MEKETLKKNIEDEVSKIFSAKEEAEIRKQTEEALIKSAETIKELTAALDGKSEVVDYLSAVGSELNKKIDDINSKLEAAKEEVEMVSNKLSHSENTIVEMEKDLATEKRIKELEEAEVLTDADVQTAKVRDMSDEDFTAYKEDRVVLRKAVIAELIANKEEEENKEDADTGGEKANQSDEDASNEDEEILPANVDPSVAVSGLMNMEVASKDIVSKYQELGEAIKL